MTRKSGTISQDTKTRLFASAVDEFAAHGFQKASLRRICAGAGVTTGALYFFFQDKEDLFHSVVTSVTDPILKLMQDHYQAEITAFAETMTAESGEAEDFHAAEGFMELYFANRTICDIVLGNRDHPVVQSFFDRLTEMTDRQTLLLFQQPSFAPFRPRIFNDYTIHWLSHLMIDAVLHIISHGLGEEQAKEQLKIMVRFLRGGAMALLAE